MLPVIAALVAGCDALAGPRDPAPSTVRRTSLVLATPEGETRPIAIYLPRRFMDEALGLQAVARSGRADLEPAQAALAALIAGPDGDERADDFQYPLDRRTAIRAVRVEDGTALIDFGAEIDRVRGRPFSELVYWSLVYTLTEVPGVERVALRREGEALTQLGDPFYAVPATAGRADAPAWARPRAEPRSTPVPRP